MPAPEVRRVKRLPPVWTWSWGQPSAMFRYLIITVLLGTVLRACTSENIQNRRHWLNHSVPANERALTLEEEVEDSVRNIWTTLEPPKNGHYQRQAKDACWARTEMAMYPRANKDPPSEAFKQRLEEYEKMRLRCTKPILSWFMFYKSRGTKLNRVFRRGYGWSSISGCKYLYWTNPVWAGVGNQLQSLVATFVYALLTDRVLVLPTSSTAALYLCNPFRLSHWAIDVHHHRHILGHIRFLAPALPLFLEEMRRWEAGGTDLSTRASLAVRNHTMMANLRYNNEASDRLFFCPPLQEALARGCIHLSIETEEYFVPALYLIPDFKRELDRLFPDRCAMMHCSRLLLVPTNVIWGQATRIYDNYLNHHHHLVGVQVRTFHNADGATRPRVLDCAVNVSRYLPPPLSAAECPQGGEPCRSPPPPSGRSVGVFITSLHFHHYTAFKDKYGHGRAADGSSLHFYTESSAGVENRRNGSLLMVEDVLVEMFVLSFSDRLLTSEYSSFGYIPAALAGVRPYLMNIGVHMHNTDWKKNKRSVCGWGSVEPCYPEMREPLTCGGVAQEAHEMVEEVRRCPRVEHGIYVVPKGED